MFCKATVEQIQVVKEVLHTYERYSGQKINLGKSAIFFSKNTAPETKIAICNVLDGITEHSSSKYLGLPMVIGRSKK